MEEKITKYQKDMNAKISGIVRNVPSNIFYMASTNAREKCLQNFLHIYREGAVDSDCIVKLL